MSELPGEGEEEYLGDGLYVSFDGWQIMLRAPRALGDDWIGIEPDVYRNFRSWIDRHPRLKRHMEGT